MKMNRFRYFIVVFALFFTSINSFGYLTLGESAEVLPENTYQFGFEPQIILSSGGGTNWGAFFDGFLSESSTMRVLINTGKVDFNSQFTLKFVPIPDVDNQPAMGIRTGIGITRIGEENTTYLHLAPILSKKVQTNGHELIPYAGLLFNYNFPKSGSSTSSQMVLGTEFKVEQTSDIKFTAELGFSLSNSISHLSATVSIPFDRTSGFKR